MNVNINAMKKFLVFSILAAFLFTTAAVAQENPNKKKAKAIAEQKVNPEKGKSEAAQAEHKGTKGKSTEAQAEHKKMKKEKKQKKTDDRVPSVIRDRNIP